MKNVRPVLKEVPLNQHPLKPLMEISKELGKVESKPFLDPLNEIALDPLSKMVAEVSFKEKQEKLKESEVKSSFEPWSLKKPNILAKYTTLEKLTITSSFLTPIAGAVKDKGINFKQG